ncbi:MAG: hypothetical protein OXH95_06140 [bacterium]|nr:hypothetical protein [bacterium]
MPWAIFLAVAAVGAMLLLPRWWAERASYRSAQIAFKQGSQPAAEVEEEPEIVPRESYRPLPPPARPYSSREAILARRRRTLTILLGGVIGSLLGWFVLNSLWMILLNLIFDALLIFFVVLLRRIIIFQHNIRALREYPPEQYVPATNQQPTVRVVRAG